MGGERSLIPLPQREHDQTVEVTDSPFEPGIRVIGPERPWLGHPYNTQRLRSVKGKAYDVVVHQIYVESYYDEQRTGTSFVAWYRANTDTAEPLKVVAITRKRIACGERGACRRYEHFGITVPDALLRSRQGSGFQVKIYARSGHTAVLTVDADQITQQLAALDRLAAQGR